MGKIQLKPYTIYKNYVPDGLKAKSVKAKLKNL